MAAAEQVAFTSGIGLLRRTLPSRETICGEEGVGRILGRQDWLHEVRVQIKELLLLDEAWDGAVASPIDSAAVDWAVQVVTLLNQHIKGLRRPYVSPTANGGVNLEWHAANAHFDITVEDEVWVYAAAEQEWECSIRELPAAAFEVLSSSFADRWPPMDRDAPPVSR